MLTLISPIQNLTEIKKKNIYTFLGRKKCYSISKINTRPNITARLGYYLVNINFV